MPGFPIDYVAIAAAVSACVQLATGLPSNSVVMAEAEGPVANRPTLPYCTYKITTAAVQYGDDSLYPDFASDGSVDGFFYAGPRGLTIAFDFYGRNHLEAYNYGTQLQMGLNQEGVIAPLYAANVSVWNCGDVVDLSTLLTTGFEGRAHLSCVFGATAVSDTTVNSVASVGVTGVITDDSLVQHPIDLDVSPES